jgi:periplasmic protein TonB
MPHALLLSPDDQAVSAITGVLEEMSVSCERPLDGVSAAQKLSSQSFDLVLVDCENLPAAKLIFDVCRRGKNGNNPVPIAIVDGRAGLPTAFRLGAELILTKPVAKDQARSTIRTAVSRLRKDPAASEGFSAAMVTDRAAEVAASTVGMGAAITGTGMHEEDAPALVAASVSPQLTSFAEPAPSFISPPVSKAVSNSVVEVSGGVASAAGPGGERSPVSANPSIRLNPDKSSPDKSGPDKSSPDKSSLDKSSKDKDKDEGKESSPVTSLRFATTGAGLKPSTQSPISIPRPSLVMKPSDDPVLAELERSELEETERKNAVGDKEGQKEAPTEVVARRPHRQPKKEGALVGMFMLTVACGGFYAAWTYQPDFRAMAQPKVQRLLALAGMALPPVQAPQSIRSSAPARPIAAAVATPAPSRNLKDAAPKPATEELSIAVGASAPLPSLATSAAVAPSITATMTPVSQTETNKSGASKIGDNIADSKNEGPAVSSEARVAEESNAIIISSKGAEKRLIHSVPPKYSAEARSRGAQGTIVLKIVVDENGKVASVGLVEGNAALANSAIEAVKQWRYRPYERDGKNLSFQTVVIVDFQRS